MHLAAELSNVSTVYNIMDIRGSSFTKLVFNMKFFTKLKRKCRTNNDSVLSNMNAFKTAYKSSKTQYWNDSHSTIKIEKPYSTTSMICNQSFFDMPFFQYWAEKVHDNFVDLMKSTNQLMPNTLKQKVVYHRKLWEFVYICQALYERNLLERGKRGVTFGVGTECLPALFASMGCEILATDLPPNSVESKEWIKTNQHIGFDVDLLNRYKICDDLTFEKKVSYRNVNMNEIPNDIINYDFCWSACALEHIGSLQLGLDFVKNSLKTLKPSGIAIHTSEYNLTSDSETLDSPNLVIFRKKDIERLISEVEAAGHYVWPIDWHIGTNVVDNFIDLPPYSQKDMHLRLLLDGYASTSFGLIIRCKS